MKPLACMLLLAASSSVELFDETVTIARGKWNFFDVIPLRQRAATVDARFQVLSGPKQVRLALMTHRDAEHMDAEDPYGVLIATHLAARGTLTYRASRPDDYVLVVDNRDGTVAATVRVQASLDFGPPRAPEAIQATPARQITVIVLSFLFFFGVVTYSARRILRALRQ
jgi:hypothetical protein